MNLIIFGSCVSRDAIEFDDQGIIQLAGYFARSSLGSAFYETPVLDINVDAIDSSFQRKMVCADMEKEFPQFLISTSFDLLLYDPIDERFDLRKIQDGGVFTLSNEAAKIGLHNGENVACIYSGSRDFFDLWEVGWCKLIDLLRSMGRLHHLRVNKVYWAKHTESGQNFLPHYDEKKIASANAFLNEIYLRMAIDIPSNQFYEFQSELLIGSDAHKWGKSPFHFVDRYYMSLIRKISMEKKEVLELSHQPNNAHESSPKSESHYQTLERDILEESVFELGERHVDSTSSIGKLKSNGDVEYHGNFVVIKFPNAATGYYVDLPIKNDNKFNGMTISYQLENWADIKYLAIGLMIKNEFKHVKIVHPTVDSAVNFSFGFQDISYQIQNGWGCAGEDVVDKVRVYIKSNAPPSNIGVVKLNWFSLWRESNCFDHSLKSVISDMADREGLFISIKRYFKACNPDIELQVEKFLREGSFPLSGNSALNWRPADKLPDNFNEVGTYRYLWHAMQPAISMMVYSEDQKNIGALVAARDYINTWMDNSFFNPDDDKKFAWYDHGTAERLLGLLYMYYLGLRHGFDFRFLARLHYVCVKHAQLLESEVFYASHQSTRYHNHAWFQDIALVAFSAVFRSSAFAKRMLNKAIFRLADQFKKLIIRDQGFSVFVENSIGYHNGILRLAGFVDELLSYTEAKSELPETIRELNHWSTFMRYPDGRSPSQGDTFRRSNILAPEKRKHEKTYEKPQLVILSKAGYAIAKGNHDNKPFMLCVFATSLVKTHKHEDNLSFTLHFDGVEWFIDPSMYSHEYKAPIPAYLRSAIAHNAIAVPHLPYSLDPGVAKITGKLDGKDYHIDGEHEAYPGMLIKRSMKGQLDRLKIAGNDEIVFAGKDKSLEKYLVFHAGEGVTVTVNNESVLLSHPASSYLLKLSCNEKIYNINYGWNENSIKSSCSGLGFMQQAETFSVLYTFSRSAAWNIEVVGQ